MRRGEVCALRWSGLSGSGAVTVSHALGNGDGGFYVKEPKTAGSLRTIPLARRAFDMLRLVRADAVRIANGFALLFGGPYTPGTQEEKSRPYSPTRLEKGFAAFCKTNGFKCTFHDLRHTFATMMIAGGCDVRTVASYLGHASVPMALDVYADVDPEAKRAAVGKVEESLGAETGVCGDTVMESAIGAPKRRESALGFSVEQLKAMLAAEEEKAGHGSL